jgi:hypothetical protein
MERHLEGKQLLFTGITAASKLSSSVTLHDNVRCCSYSPSCFIALLSCTYWATSSSSLFSFFLSFWVSYSLVFATCRARY